MFSLAAILIGSAASAFESDEHRYFTNAAICFLEGELSRKTEKALWSQSLRSVLENARSLGHAAGKCKSKPLSLGDVTLYADYVPAPRRLRRTRETKWARLNAVEICERNDDFFFGITELIRNPHHFGGDGLAEYYSWHEHALLLAARAGSLLKLNSARAEDTLVDALIYESYAVHFLQDFFAPGHLQAFETKASISETLRRHDLANLEGDLFILNGEQVRRALDPSKSIGARDPGEIVACMEMDDVTAGETQSELLFQINREGRIHLEGDNRVLSTTMGKMYRPTQAAFLAWVTSLSFADLFQVFEQPDLDWRYLTFRPSEGCAEGGGYGLREEGDDYDAWLPIGHFQKGRLKEPCPEATPPGREHSVEIPAPRTQPEGSPSSPPKPRFRRADDPVGSVFLASLPRTAFDVSLQRLNEGSRKTIGGEVFLDWWALSPFEHQTVEWSLGYTYVRGNSYDGHGPDAAAYYRIKNLYLWASLNLGYRFLSDSQGSSQAGRFGGRVGFGPEILSVFVGASRDSSIDDGKKNVDPIAFEFGVQSIIPWQRVWAFGEELFDGAGDFLTGHQP